MGFTLNEMKNTLVREREVVKNMLADMKAMRRAIRESRQLMKVLRADIRSEQQINRVVKADARAATKAARIMARNQRAHDRIAKLEARLEAMRLKANAPKQIRKNQRKASPVTVYTAEQIAAMNE
jgi:hypothetical protein